MQDSRTKNSLRNVSYNFMNQLVMLLTRFVNRSVFIQVLGVEYLGINGLFSDILQMLSMADLGFGTAMVFSLYKPLAEKDEEKIASLIGFYRRVYHVIAISISLVGIGLVPFLKYLVNLEKDLPYMEIYYLFFLANTVASYLVVYKTSILTADQKGYISAKINSTSNLLRTIVMTVFLYVTKNYFVYLTLQVIFTYATNYYVSRQAEKLYPYINKKTKLKLDESKNIVKNIKSVFIYKLSGVLVTASDNTIISVLVGTIWVGYYSNYGLIVNQLINFFNTLFSSLSASVGNLVISEDNDKRFEVFNVLQTASMIICSVSTACIYLLMPDLIKVWLGENFLLPNSVLLAVAINFYFASIVMPIWTYREATGMYQKTKYAMLATAIVNLILSVLLGKMVGLPGIIIATTIARLVTYFWYEPRILFKEYFNKSCVIYFKQIGINVLLTALMIVFAQFVIDAVNIKITNWLLLIAKAILVGMYSLIVVIVFYRKQPGFKYLLNKALSVLQAIKMQRQQG